MGITVDAAPGKLRLLADWLDATCPDGETEVQDDLRNIAKMIVGFERTIRHHESEYTRLTAELSKEKKISSRKSEVVAEKLAEIQALTARIAELEAHIERLNATSTGVSIETFGAEEERRKAAKAQLAEARNAIDEALTTLCSEGESYDRIVYAVATLRAAIDAAREVK